jgi:amidohydrolase
MSESPLVNYQLTSQQTQQLIQLRQYLHEHPELSNLEFQTQKACISALESIPVDDIQRIGTSVIAKISGRNVSGDPIIIRGDIDALPIQEASGHPYQSRQSGVMHACGHDIHTTWAIGAAHLLAKQRIDRDVYILLQQAEETAEGATYLLNSGQLPKSCVAVIGGHVDPRYELGQVVHHEGAISSASSRFEIEVLGKAAHAARPEEGQSPIPALVKIIQQLETDSNQLGDATNFISITQINAGLKHNIIPDKATVSGTLRCLSTQAENQLKAAISNYEQLDLGCAIYSSITDMSPVLLNHAALSASAAQAIAMGPSGRVPLHRPNMASEDFGFYSQHYPTWYFRIGSTAKGAPFVPVHTPEFFAPEAVIEIGARLFANMAAII